jgi:hypothetical protein
MVRGVDQMNVIAGKAAIRRFGDVSGVATRPGQFWEFLAQIRERGRRLAGQRKLDLIPIVGAYWHFRDPRHWPHVSADANSLPEHSLGIRVQTLERIGQSVMVTVNQPTSGAVVLAEEAPTRMIGVMQHQRDIDDAAGAIYIP